MEIMKAKKYEAPKYEHPIDDINWTAGVGQPAGVYWLDGRSVIAAHDSAAESALLQRGAILIATLRFDRDPLESRYHGRMLQPMSPRAAAAALLLSAVN
jgi:hypothetical protein